MEDGRLNYFHQVMRASTSNNVVTSSEIVLDNSNFEGKRRILREPMFLTTRKLAIGTERRANGGSLILDTGCWKAE